NCGASEARFHLSNPSFQFIGLCNGLALLRRPRADLATSGSAREVSVGFLVRDGRHTALNAHLALQWLPVKAHRCLSAREELASLPALVVRVEDEALFVDALQQENAHRRLSIGANSCQ